jgi:hypothetical protein
LSFCSFLSGGVGIELRVLHLLDKCATTWAMSPALFALVYFSYRVPHFFPRLMLDHDVSSYLHPRV